MDWLVCNTQPMLLSQGMLVISRACLAVQWYQGNSRQDRESVIDSGHDMASHVRQVLPFVEAFFMLCDARTAHLPAPEPAMLRAASAELAGGSSTPLSRARSGGAASLEAHLPFLRFAERHRKLLNALLRQHPSLLEGSLGPLLRVPRLVDFDNKRAYFRAKIRSQGGERHHGSLRINVRREHVFEDSFHQLRVRYGPPSPIAAHILASVWHCLGVALTAERVK